MSDYNKRTGRFELTHTKAFHWWRRRDRPAPKTMQDIADILQSLGIVVFAVKGAYLECEPRPAGIWEALSGQPADPKATAYYRCPPETIGEVYKRLHDRANTP